MTDFYTGVYWNGHAMNKYLKSFRYFEVVPHVRSHTMKTKSAVFTASIMMMFGLGSIALADENVAVSSSEATDSTAQPAGVIALMQRPTTDLRVIAYFEPVDETIVAEVESDNAKKAEPVKRNEVDVVEIKLALASGNVNEDGTFTATRGCGFTIDQLTAYFNETTTGKYYTAEGVEITRAVYDEHVNFAHFVAETGATVKYAEKDTAVPQLSSAELDPAVALIAVNE